VRVLNGATGAQVGALRTAAATATSLRVTGLANGTSYDFEVRAVNAQGPGLYSDRSNTVTPAAPVATAPSAPTIGTPVRGNASATVRWTAPTNTGGSAITGYSIRAYVGTGGTVARTVTAGATATSVVVTGLTNGTAYTFDVRAVNAVGTGTASARSVAVTPATAPSAPIIRTASSGVAGGAITATANWSAPTSTGGSAITSYRVTALRMRTDGTVAGTTVATAAPTARSLQMTLPVVNGLYRFEVQAVNAVPATSAPSARSNQVIGR
jgi:Fibronectin type III domain